MVKKIGVTILLIILTMFSFITSSLAYEDELFKFDLPSNFANMSYQNIYFFADTSEGSNSGFMIYAYENSEMKKSVWDIDDNDLDDLLRNLGYSAEVVDTNKRAKLGKEKAVEVIVTDGGAYMDMYLLASNKYIYVVMFVGDSRADLSNSDFQTVKNSFKLKDRTTNFRMVFLIIAIAIAVIIVIFRNKRNNNSSFVWTHNGIFFQYIIKFLRIYICNFKIIHWFYLSNFSIIHLYSIFKHFH